MRADVPESARTPTNAAAATTLTSQPCQLTGRQPNPTRRRRNQGRRPFRRRLELDDLRCVATSCDPSVLPDRRLYPDARSRRVERDGCERSTDRRQWLIVPAT